MDACDQIMYASCWVVLMLYVVTTLNAFTRQSCIDYTAAFLSACILWIDLSFFNAWFFIPAFMRHIREVDLRADSAIGSFQVLFTSEAAQDIYLMMLGSFGSWLAVFNAASMVRAESCRAMSPHKHRRLSKYLIKSVYRVCDCLDFRDDYVFILPIANTTYPHPDNTHYEKNNLFYYVHNPTRDTYYGRRSLPALKDCFREALDEARHNRPTRAASVFPLTDHIRFSEFIRNYSSISTRRVPALSDKSGLLDEYTDYSPSYILVKIS